MLQVFVARNEAVVLSFEFGKVVHDLISSLAELLRVKIFIQLPGHVIDLVVLLFLVALYQPYIVQFLDVFLELIMLGLFVLDLLLEFFLSLFNLLLKLVAIILHVDFFAVNLVLLLPLYFSHRLHAVVKGRNACLNMEKCLSLRFGDLLSRAHLLFHVVESLL